MVLNQSIPMLSLCSCVKSGFKYNVIWDGEKGIITEFLGIFVMQHILMTRMTRWLDSHDSLARRLAVCQDPQFWPATSPNWYPCSCCPMPLFQGDVANCPNFTLTGPINCLQLFSWFSFLFQRDFAWSVDCLYQRNPRWLYHQNAEFLLRK